MHLFKLIIIIIIMYQSVSSFSYNCKILGSIVYFLFNALFQYNNVSQESERWINVETWQVRTCICFRCNTTWIKWNSLAETVKSSNESAIHRKVLGFILRNYDYTINLLFLYAALLSYMLAFSSSRSFNHINSSAHDIYNLIYRVKVMRKRQTLSFLYFSVLSISILFFFTLCNPATHQANQKFLSSYFPLFTIIIALLRLLQHLSISQYLLSLSFTSLYMPAMPIRLRRMWFCEPS